MNLFLAKRLLTTKHQGLITIKVVILWNFNWKTVANFIVHRLLLIPHSFLHSWARLSGRNHPFNFPLVHASVPQLTPVLHTYIQVYTDSKSSFALTYRFTNFTCTPGQSHTEGEILSLLWTLSKEEQVNDSQSSCPGKHRSPIWTGKAERLEPLGFYQLFTSFSSNDVLIVWSQISLCLVMNCSMPDTML